MLLKSQPLSCQPHGFPEIVTLGQAVAALLPAEITWVALITWKPSTETQMNLQAGRTWLQLLKFFFFFKHLNILTNSWKFYAQKGGKKKKKIEEYQQCDSFLCFFPWMDHKEYGHCGNLCSEINNPMRGFICLSNMWIGWIISIFFLGHKDKGDILHYIEIIYYLDWFFTDNARFLALNRIWNV